MTTNGGVEILTREASTEEQRRYAMASFWSDKPDTVEGMMLDSNAADINAAEAPEILSYLPNLTGKKILEIGSGIGRFTSHLAIGSQSLHTVDFIQGFVDKNRQLNGHFKHVTFECNDATSVQWQGGVNSLDLIFTNWLMMYLSDEEVQNLAKRVLSWLKPGGYFFVRESCFHPSGNLPRVTNPTFYRDPSTYCQLFQVISNESGPLFEGGYEFELQFATSVKTYIKKKQNPNQICWLYRKVPRLAHPLSRTQTLQEFLDGDQYTQRGILKYEKIYGKNFISVGGRETAERFIDQLNLGPADVVLDVGAGIGGAAFLMAKKFKVHVLAMDLSSNMVTIGMQRRVLESVHEESASKTLLLDHVAFEISDISKREYDHECFDVIHSRETLLHLKDKPRLLINFFNYLKPGGRLLITDYCRGEKAEDAYSIPYRKYIQSRGYFPMTVAEYKDVLIELGFANVCAVDNSEQFKEILSKELNELERSEKTFVNEFSQYEFDQAVMSWRSKLKFCNNGDLVWGCFTAVKL